MSVGFGQKSVQLLDKARERALKDRYKDITAYHVFGALLDDDDEGVVSALKALGLSVEKARVRLASIHSTSGQAFPSATEFAYGMVKVLQIAEEKSGALGRSVAPIDLLYALLIGANPHGTLFQVLELAPHTDPELVYTNSEIAEQ